MKSILSVEASLCKPRIKRISLKSTIRLALAGLTAMPSASDASSRNAGAVPRANERQQVSCAPAAADELKKFVDALRPRVLTLPRSVRFYHHGARIPLQRAYGSVREAIQMPTQAPQSDRMLADNPLLGPLNAWGPVPLRPYLRSNRRDVDVAADYFSALASSFFRGERQDWTWGGALYAAADPLSSVGYADPFNPFMLEIEVPSGIAVLDVRGVLSAIDPRAADAARRTLIAADACGNRTSGEVATPRSIERSYERISLRDFLPKQRSRAFLAEAFKRLGVRFLIAAWWTSLYEQCLKLNQRINARGAMAVFFDPTLAQEATFRIFVPALETEPPPEKAAAYDRMLRLMRMGSWQDIRYVPSWAAVLNELPAIPRTEPEPDLSEFFACSSAPEHSVELRGPGGTAPSTN